MASNFDEGKLSFVAQANDGARLDLQLGRHLIDGENERIIVGHSASRPDCAPPARFLAQRARQITDDALEHVHACFVPWGFSDGCGARMAKAANSSTSAQLARPTA